MEEHEKIIVFIESCIIADQNNGVKEAMANKRITDEDELLKPISVRLFDLNDNVLYFIDYFFLYIKDELKVPEAKKKLEDSILKVIRYYIDFICIRNNPYGETHTELNTAQLYHNIHVALEQIINLDSFAEFMHRKEHDKIFGEDAEYGEFSVISMYNVADYVTDAIDRILTVNNVIDNIHEFIADDLTNIYFVRVISGNSIFMEKCEDFRIYQWEKQRIEKLREKQEIIDAGNEVPE